MSRKENPLSILLLDVDHFQMVNHTYGHFTADSILKQFSELLIHSVRADDFVFRYGGDEFLIILANADLELTLELAERIRLQCENHHFVSLDKTHIQLTCSIGCSVYEGQRDYNLLVTKADMALWKAKAQSRNQIQFVLESSQSE